MGRFTQTHTPETDFRKNHSFDIFLCKFHNYCIDEREEACYQRTRDDTFYSAINGSIAMCSEDKGNVLATEITHGGEHSDNFDRRRVMHNNLPRDKMLATVRNKYLRRPIKLS